MKPKTFQELRVDFQLPDKHLLFTTRSQHIGSRYPNLFFQGTLLDKIRLRHKNTISNIYPHVQTVFLQQPMENTTAPREKDFQKHDLNDLMIEGNNAIRRLIKAENKREAHLKFMHWAYSTFFPQNTKAQKTSFKNKCPKCGTNKPTLKHCWWECKPIQRYWTEIINYVKQVTRQKLTKDPHLCLLNILPTTTPETHETNKRIGEWT